jgi:hypothetical protein
MSRQVNAFDLSRKWFEFARENYGIVNPNHAALYFHIIDLCNELRWPESVGLPNYHAMASIGIKNYKTYKKALDDLVEFGFIKMVKKSTNQHTSNVVALVIFTEAHTEAHTKAEPRHIPKHIPRHIPRHGSHNKTINNKQETINDIEGNFAETENGLQKEKEISEPQSKKTNLGETENPEPKKIKKTTAKKNEFIPPTKDEFIEFAKTWFKEMDYPNFEKYEIAIREKYSVWSLSGWVNGKTNEKIKNWKSTLGRTLKFIKQNVDEQVSRNNARPGSDNPLSPTYRGMVW